MTGIDIQFEFRLLGYGIIAEAVGQVCPCQMFHSDVIGRSDKS